MPKVLAIPIHEDAAVVANTLRVPAAEVRVEESVRDTPQRLHRCLEAVSTDVELDASFLLLLVHLHGRDLAMEFVSPRIDLGKPLGALLG
jgi:hypothetical protein